MSVDHPNSQTNFKNSAICDELREISPDLNPPSDKECRICLSRSQDNSSSFISPCRCSGSIKYVHQQCLKQWIERVMQKNVSLSNGTESAKCQLCKSYFVFQIQVQRKCFDCSEIRKNISSNQGEFGILTFCIIASLMLLIYSVVQLVLMLQQGFSTIDLAARIVIICSISLSVGTMIYLTPKFRNFFIKYKAELKFQNVQQ